jgi:hypothetical protein
LFGFGDQRTELDLGVLAQFVEFAFRERAHARAVGEFTVGIERFLVRVVERARQELDVIFDRYALTNGHCRRTACSPPGPYCASGTAHASVSDLRSGVCR